MSLEPLRRHRALTTPALDPGRLARLAGALAAVEGAEVGLDGADARLHGAWSGRAANAAALARARRRTQAGALAADLAAARGVLAAAAAAQQDTRTTADRVLALWWVTAWPAWTPAALVATRWACAALAAASADLRAELDRLAHVLDGLGAEARTTGPAVPPDGARALAGGVAVPPAGTSPAAVAAWWARVGPLDVARLDGRTLDELADRPGLPPVVLDQVNRRRLGRDEQLTGAVGDRARATRSSLTAAQASAAAPPIGPVLLLGYSSEGPGGVAVAFGDPSRADTVAVTVPGTSNAPGTPGLTDQAVALRRRLDADSPGTASATVTWLGYDAPDSLTDPAVASPAGAAAGAPRLVADVAGLAAAADATGHGGQRVTVVGHSYGSTVVGLAAAQGLAADDVVLVGSPGAGVASADQLSPGRGHVWVGATEHDPVVAATGGRWFTTAGSSTGVYDPGFGGRAFAAPDAAGALDAHSDYYDPGSESLANLSAITRGATGAVSAPDGLDAPGGTGAPGPVLDLLTDPVRGQLSVAGELLRGDPVRAGDAALRSAAETGSDVLDVVLGGLGAQVGGVGGLLGLR